MMRRIGYRMCLEGRRCWREYSCAVDVASMLVQGKSLNLRGRNGSGKSKTCDHVVVEEEARGRKIEKRGGRKKSGKYKTGGTPSQIVLVTVAHLIENVLPLSAVLI